MSNLASTYFQQGRRKEAEELALRVLDNKMLGDSYIEDCSLGCASTQDSQAAVYQAQPLRALRWLRRVVTRR